MGQQQSNRIEDASYDTRFTKFQDWSLCIRMRIPYLFQSLTGINTNFYTSINVPMNLLTCPTREEIKGGAVEEIKNKIFKQQIEVDESLDVYSKHTLLHDAVVLDRQELFDFLVQQGANLMVRDQNGYTPLLKAASLGREDMCKQLVEAGVDPMHVDPYGNTPREKCLLYSHTQLAEWFKEQEDRYRKGEKQVADWSTYRRIGKCRSFLDY